MKPLFLLLCLPALACAQTALDKKPRSAAKLASDGASLLPTRSRTHATPVPAQLSAAQTAAAMQEAVREYPDLARSGSDLHTRFMTEMEAARTTRPKLFAEANWPTQLARKIAAQLAAQELEGGVQIVGAVLQHTEDGILITTDARVPKSPYVSALDRPVPVGVDLPRAEGLVLLRGHPEATNLADEERVQAIAFPSGLYQYRTTLGAMKTVRAYAIQRP